MPNAVPSSVYEDRAKAQVAVAADALAEHWETKRAIEDAWQGPNRDETDHYVGMRDALQAIAMDLRS